MLQRDKANPKQDSQVAPDLVSKPGTEKSKDAEADAVSEPVLKPEIKAAAKPKTKGADGRREAAEARREAAKKARSCCQFHGRLLHLYSLNGCLSRCAAMQGSRCTMSLRCELRAALHLQDSSTLIDTNLAYLLP